jgi:hypothetical protein
MREKCLDMFCVDNIMKLYALERTHIPRIMKELGQFCVDTCSEGFAHTARIKLPNSVTVTNC